MIPLPDQHILHRYGADLDCRSPAELRQMVADLQQRCAALERENQTLLHDQQEFEQIATALQRNSTLRRLIMTISHRFINLHTDAIDQEFQRALQAISLFAEVDISSISIIDSETRRASQVYWWAVPGGTLPEIDLVGASMDDYPWSAEKYRAGELVLFSSRDTLPDRALPERRLLEQVGCAALVSTPMICEGQLLGTVSFMTFTDKQWSADTIDMLTAVGDIFGSAVLRKRTADALHASRCWLEERVQERTARLQQSNMALHIEIAERQRFEQSLRESEERFRAVWEHATDAMALTDANGLVLMTNPAYHHLYGYTPQDVVGRPFVVIFAEESRAEALRLYRDIFATPHADLVYETPVVRADGQERIVESHISFLEQDGRRTAMLSVVRDITARKRAEHALMHAYSEQAELNSLLHQSRHLLISLVNGLSDGLVLLSARGMVQIANQSFAELLQRPLDRIQDCDWRMLYPHIAPDFPGHLALAEAEAIASQHITIQEYRHRSADDTVRVFTLQFHRIYNAADELHHVIVRISDVTHQLQLQQRVIENEHFAATGRLAASVAHEINTPLQSIQFALELLRIAKEEDRAVPLENALSEIKRVGRIVRQMLDMHRSGNETPGPVNIAHLIERILLLIGKRIRDQRVTVDYTAPAGNPLVHGRDDELMQVLLNVVANALDAMRTGGTLTIETGPAPTAAALDIVVQDSGCGIRPDLQARIFEPFVTTRKDGTGLGLSISRDIVEQHGGSILLESHPGAGSRFTIRLPGKLQPAPAPHASKPARKARKR